MSTDFQEQVTVTFTVGDWAKIVAATATSGLSLFDKERLNSVIYDATMRTERALS